MSKVEYSILPQIMLNPTNCYQAYAYKYNKKITYPILIQGKIPEINCKFMIYYGNLKLKIYYEIKTEPETITFDHIMNILNGKGNYSTVFSTYIYNEKIIISDKELKAEMMFHLTSLKNIISYIEEKHIFKVIRNEILIDCKMNLITKIMSNIKMVHKYSKLFGEKVESKDIIIKEGSEIIVNDSILLKYIVSKITDKRYKYSIEIKIANNIKNIFYPNKIKLLLYEEENKTTVYIFYFFKKPFNYSEFISFQFKQQKELQKLKDIIEHFQKKNIIN